MNYSDYILQVLGFLGLPALFTLYLTERVKGNLKNSFDKKLEEFKNENSKEIEGIKKENSIEISGFQTELNHLKSKENFKFTKLHEIRLKVLAKTYQLLNENLVLLEGYTSPTKIIPDGKTFDESEKEFSLRYKEAHNKFIRYFNHNAIYLSEDMEKLIRNYVASSAKIFDTYDLKLHYPKSDAKVLHEVYLVYRKIPEIIYPLKKELEVKFRELLGE